MNVPFPVRSVAAMIGREVFFEPEAVTLPEIRRPPRMTSLSMYWYDDEKPIFTIISGHEKQIIIFGTVCEEKVFILYL